MRVGAIGHDDAGQRRHLVRDVGVQVQRDTDRQIGPNDCAQPAQQFALAVVAVLGYHGAVHAQQHRIERALSAQRRLEFSYDGVEGLARNFAGWRGVGRDRMHQFPAVALSGVQKGSHLGSRAAVIACDFRTTEQAARGVGQQVGL